MWFKTKTIGQIGEDLAVKHYKSLGYTVLTKRFFNRVGKQFGEIDFIAKKDDILVFVEVKTRTQEEGKFGTAVEAVNKSKQHKLIKIVEVFLQKHQEFIDFNIQIDVCAVLLNPIDKQAVNVTIIPNAVEDYR